MKDPDWIDGPYEPSVILRSRIEAIENEYYIADVPDNVSFDEWLVLSGKNDLYEALMDELSMRQ